MKATHTEAIFASVSNSTGDDFFLLELSIEIDGKKLRIRSRIPADQAAFFLAGRSIYGIETDVIEINRK